MHSNGRPAARDRKDPATVTEIVYPTGIPVLYLARVKTKTENKICGGSVEHTSTLRDRRLNSCLITYMISLSDDLERPIILQCSNSC